MTLIQLHCSTCERDVYVPEEDTPVCPVCSGTLIATIPIEEESAEEADRLPD